jgi:hypothetical protein
LEGSHKNRLGQILPGMGKSVRNTNNPTLPSSR